MKGGFDPATLESQVEHSTTAALFVSQKLLVRSFTLRIGYNYISDVILKKFFIIHVNLIFLKNWYLEGNQMYFKNISLHLAYL